MMVKMTHGNLKLGGVVTWHTLNLDNCPVKLLFGFLQVKNDRALIHNGVNDA